MVCIVSRNHTVHVALRGRLRQRRTPSFEEPEYSKLFSLLWISSLCSHTLFFWFSGLASSGILWFSYLAFAVFLA